MSGDLGTAAQLVEMPDDAVPEFGMTLVSYVDSEGDQMYAYQTHGETSFGSLIGLMQMVAHDLMHLIDDE